MMKKSRDHQILVIIMAHIDSNLVRQIYSTLSSNAYNDVLQQIDFLKRLAAQRNKYAQRDISGRNSTLYPVSRDYTSTRVHVSITAQIIIS